MPDSSPLTLAAGAFDVQLTRCPPTDQDRRHPLMKDLSLPPGTVELRYAPPVGGLPILMDPKQVGEYLREHCNGQLADPREHSWILALSTKNRLLIPPYLLGIGAVDQCFMPSNHIAQVALLANARHIILAHSHPSGDVAPSPHDRHITVKIQEALALFNITLHDHVILAGHAHVSGPKWYSFKAGGLL